MILHRNHLASNSYNPLILGRNIEQALNPARIQNFSIASGQLSILPHSGELVVRHKIIVLSTLRKE